jgi:hypothetical protein
LQISIKIGFALTKRIELEVAKNELGVVKTLSPSFNKHKEAKCKLAVPLDVTIEYLASQYLEIAFSNFNTLSPVVNKSDCKVLVTKFISS